MALFSQSTVFQNMDKSVPDGEKVWPRSRHGRAGSAGPALPFYGISPGIAARGQAPGHGPGMGTSASSVSSVAYTRKPRRR